MASASPYIDFTISRGFDMGWRSHQMYGMLPLIILFIFLQEKHLKVLSRVLSDHHNLFFFKCYVLERGDKYENCSFL